MILRIVSIALFAFSFFIVLLSDGGVYQAYVSMATIVMALSMMVALIRYRLHAETAKVFFVGLLIWFLLSGWTVLQSVPLPGGVWANAAWRHAAEAGISAPETISVSPGNSLYSLLPVSLVLMTFLTTLLLFRSDKQAESALRVFAISGAALALFAIIQFELFPRTLMFSPKQIYISSLTAPFVNRNTAATFYGVVLISLLVCLSLEISSANSSRRRKARMIDPRWMYAGMAVVVLLALALTTSIAGIGATMLAVCCFAAPVFFWHRRAAAGRRMPAARRGAVWSLPLLTLGGAAFVGVFAVMLFGQALMRLEQKTDGTGEGRLCVYPGIMRAIGDNWQTGIGAGSFEHYYAAYYDPECGMTDVWARAHNSYFELALAYGVVVSLAVLGLAGLVVFTSFRRGLERRRSKKPIVLGGIAVSTLVMNHSMVDFSMQIPGFAMTFMFFTATAIAVSLNRSGKNRIVT